MRAVLDRFLDLASPEQSRMRQLLQGYPVDDFINGLGLYVRRDAAVLRWQRHVCEQPWLGAVAQLDGMALGVAPPLGRLSPAMLRGAARVARQWGMAACA